MEAARAAPAADKRRHPFPWLNLMATEPFYLLHFLLFFSYLGARSSASQTLSADIIDRLFRREIQAILAFLVLVAVKMVKEETWEAFIAKTLLYAKQPPYDGLGDCSQLTPLQLESLLTEGSTSKFWLVEFRALCSSTCVQKSRIFPDLSVIYSNKNISFGVVDIGHFPNAAEKFGISLPGQIPTYILFENAVEVARLPEFSYTEASVPTISKKKA
ncbi:thioredoxin-related transmembrane protein [Musa troglodytarum]|uniref:Thioredoxin-related transmembrane protein n=1 Tax=Musa troglodytarum TaxID=320322 RepID=A0A9E7LB06_9LILI|nr:thioredoxin-related transmembrane protein [Musa troglodytarum]